MKEISRAIQSLKQAATQPVGRSISSEIHTVEVTARSELPHDYKVLLEQFGAFAIDNVQLLPPSEICSYAATIWNLQQLAPAEWAVLPIAIVSTSGDSIGFLRTGTRFMSTIYLLKHEISWQDLNNAGEALAPNFAEWIVGVCERTKPECSN